MQTARKRRRGWGPTKRPIRFRAPAPSAPPDKIKQSDTFALTTLENRVAWSKMKPGPATEKQVAYAHGLTGLASDELATLSKREISEVIDIARVGGRQKGAERATYFLLNRAKLFAQVPVKDTSKAR